MILFNGDTLIIIQILAVILLLDSYIIIQAMILLQSFKEQCVCNNIHRSIYMKLN